VKLGLAEPNVALAAHFDYHCGINYVTGKIVCVGQNLPGS
jgi:hypothetical protein